MFSGILANRRQGTSKTGNQYYLISVFVDTPERRIQADFFVDQDIYKKVENVPFNTSVTCISGVNEFGRLYVKDINSGK